MQQEVNVPVLRVKVQNTPNKPEYSAYIAEREMQQKIQATYDFIIKVRVELYVQPDIYRNQTCN